MLFLEKFLKIISLDLPSFLDSGVSRYYTSWYICRLKDSNNKTSKVFFCEESKVHRTYGISLQRLQFLQTGKSIHMIHTPGAYLEIIKMPGYILPV